MNQLNIIHATLAYNTLMNLIVIHKNNPDIVDANRGSEKLLQFALTSEPIAGVILDGLSRSSQWGRGKKIVYAIPEQWKIESRVTHLKTINYKDNVPICPKLLKQIQRNSWFIVSNGRFAPQIDSKLLHELIAKIQADIVEVNAEPKLLSKQEKIRLTAQGKVAGFRRLYSNSAELSSISTDWPHYLFIKTNVLNQVFIDDALPNSFSTLLKKCRSNKLTLRSIKVGGTVLDLEMQNGLLNFCRTSISKFSNSRFNTQNSDNKSTVSRFSGKVLLGKNVQIAPKAILIGPTIIGNNVKIENGVVINSSIIGPEVSVPQNQLVQNCIIKGPKYDWKQHAYSLNKTKQIYYTTFGLNRKQQIYSRFRTWSKFSYAGSLKRVIDCSITLIVLILFAPIVPFIALAIKLNSPGPVFFKDKRQGMYGKTFNCLKFRTMHLGAEKMQDKLRLVSQVDGPQFKMSDDPRISAVGRFLRETYLDEIPQFINVLIGQMSVIGPRPSPESENTLCPFWRDARLSVRPGITGLWQICRTRQPMKDFQEWIHYDIEYVRNLSIRMDLWIFWQTTKKLFDNFVKQF